MSVTWKKTCENEFHEIFCFCSPFLNNNIFRFTSNMVFFPRTSKESIYIVVDTNVFIDRLEDILSLVKKPQPSHPYFVYIPWIVLQELDGLKSNVNAKLQKAASKAAREILELFNARNKRLSGQNGKMDNEAKEMFKIQDPLNDDKIIQACLQLRKDGKHVQLVSFDNILKIKAHSYQIEIFQTNKLQSVQVATKKRAAPVVSIFSPILRIFS